MSWMYIEPSDVLFFRNAQPFNAGEGHTAHSIFPPSPATVAGALRSMVLGSSNVGWADFKNGRGGAAVEIAGQIGSPNGLGPVFQQRGPFLAQRRTNEDVLLLAPLPADAYQLKAGEPNFDAFQPLKTAPFTTQWPDKAALHPLWSPHGQRFTTPEQPYWLPPLQLEHYLYGEPFAALPQANFFGEDGRIGIALNHAQRRPKEGMLYTAPFTALRDTPTTTTGLLVWVDDAVGVPDSGWLALGGEARAARLYLVDPQKLRAPFAPVKPATKLKLLLLTPAFFEAGWQPKKGAWDTVLPAKMGASLKSAALGRPRYLGGYDIAMRQQKPIHSYVPAGSVYHFEFNKPVDPAELQAIAFTQSPLSLELDRLGFGCTAAGAWHWQTP